MVYSVMCAPGRDGYGFTEYLPLPRLFKAQSGHTEFVLGTIWAQSELMHHFVRVTQAALTKILPGEEDRFGK